MSDLVSLKKNLSQYGQEHLLYFWDTLTEQERKQLTEDIDDINFKAVIDDFKLVTADLEKNAETKNEIKPVPKSLFGDYNETTENVRKNYEQEGFRLISTGKLGVLVLAGGQGTRLGVTHPKGMYDVGLPSHKTLFQLQAERILKLQNLACLATKKPSTITWFIMVSESTLQPTSEFLEKHNYFGLKKENIFIFEQFSLPAFTFDGKMFLEKKYRVSMSPDGNGGLYRALRDRKILDEMKNRGIAYIHAFSIDNIILKVGDPIFLGYCYEKKADCGVKVIEKVVPTEAIGVVCLVNEKWQVVEYSEMPRELSEKRANDGSLTFKAGNICNHLFSTKFLQKIAEQYIPKLKLHVAKKKIKFTDQDGNQIKPKEPNGIKMEKFIFDVFPFAEKLVVWEVNRDEEFSALKNADSAGQDCPSTARKSLFKLHKKWIEKAGGKVEGEICEISPLLSYSGENLEELVKGKTFTSPVHLQPKCD